MMRRFEYIRALCLMARGADLDLGGRRPNRVFRGMQRVATGAGHIACRVRARGPVMRCIRFMAAQALRVLQWHWRLCFRAKIDHSGERSATRLHMRAPRAVARLALQTAMAEGTMRVIGSGMLGTEDSGNTGVAMTPKTGIRSLWTIARLRMRWPPIG